jgi:phosphoserine phosphatase
MDFDLLIFDVEGTLTRAEFFERLRAGERQYEVAFRITDRVPAAVVDVVSPLLREKVIRLAGPLRMLVVEAGRTLFIADENADYDTAQHLGCAFMWANDFF